MGRPIIDLRMTTLSEHLDADQGKKIDLIRRNTVDSRDDQCQLFGTNPLRRFRFNAKSYHKRHL